MIGGLMAATSSDGSLGAILMAILLGAALYLLPSAVALARKHRQRVAIVALNVLTGWTMIGWIAALIWALTSERKDVQVVIVRNDPPTDDEWMQSIR